MRKGTKAALIAAMLGTVALAACTSPAETGAEAESQAVGDFVSEGALPFALEKAQAFDQPWAMAFLPDGKAALVSTRSGTLYLWPVDGAPIAVAGTPAVRVKEQGGLGDIVLAPDYTTSGLVYFTFAEPEGDAARAALARAKLDLTDMAAPKLADVQVLWRQSQLTENPWHYSHRIAFAPDGKHLFLTSGERALKDPAQDVASNLGKVLRLKLDGTPAEGNPFAGQGGAADEIWSMGHRNLLGIAFDRDGRLWDTEMGPAGGDELNLIEAGRNYGWPLVSNGQDYDGTDIPDHPTRPEFTAPQLYWDPSVAPSSLHVVAGNRYPGWQGKALIGGLAGQAIMLVSLEGGRAKLEQRWPLDWRVRGFAESPDGTIYAIEDGEEGGIYRLSAK